MHKQVRIASRQLDPNKVLTDEQVKNLERRATFYQRWFKQEQPRIVLSQY